MKGKSRKTALTQTTKEYESRSSIHGISYLFDLDLGIADRLLWLFLVLAFAAVAAALTWNLWSQWRNEQVIKDMLEGSLTSFCTFPNFNTFTKLYRSLRS